MTRIWLCFVIIPIFSACVPNRKYVYFQKDDVKSKDLPRDTVVRDYSIKSLEYRVQSNDALYITFESLTNEEFDFLKKQSSGQAGGGGQSVMLNSELVDPDGDIVYPVLGKIKVAGLTMFEIQNKLQQLADQYLESPVVSVRLSNFRFTVLGEVKSEGTISSFNTRTTLPEALGLAGGLDELANKENIKILRQKNGKVEVAYINLLDENIIESPYYYIHQNDVLVVPPLRQRPFRRYFGSNVSLVLSSISIILLIINLSN
jgi:polysaccharide biosynthesis/export protein